MQILALWRLAAILLLAAAPLAAPALADGATAAFADNGKANDDESDDGNRGHGNDPDGVDEDNPGNSGNKKDKDDKDDKEKDTGKAVETVPVAGYVIAVDCHPTEDGAATRCDITAAAPEGGKDVGFVQVPADILCADVVETDAELVDPDPNTHVTGYTSRGAEGSLTLILDGAATPAGIATYWIKTGGGIFPVEGPGLSCDLAPEAGSASATVTVQFDVTPAATEAPSTGTVAVAVLTCAGVPADTAGFDWFGACQPGADPARAFSLAPSGGAAPVTATTDTAGEATFADLAPGDYRLELVEGAWCHAASDRVTAESEVVVEAGVTSRVWIFVCDGKAEV